MKVCHSCGTEVKDKELVCPVCGATVVKSTGDFSLKAVEETKKKKKGNPMGTHVSTGSGLTDILKGDDSGYLVDEEDFRGGSIPTSYSKTDVDELGIKETKSSYIKYVILLVIVLAVGFFVYNMYSTYKANKRGKDSYEGVIEDYVLITNNRNKETFDNLMPKYMEMDKATASSLYKSITNIKIVANSLAEVSHLNSSEISELQELIKMASVKTAAIQDAVTVNVKIDAEVKNAAGGTITKSSEIKLTIICVRDRWFLEPYSSDIPFEDN